MRARSRVQASSRNVSEKSPRSRLPARAVFIGPFFSPPTPPPPAAPGSCGIFDHYVKIYRMMQDADNAIKAAHLINGLAGKTDKADYPQRPTYHPDVMMAAMKVEQSTDPATGEALKKATAKLMAYYPAPDHHHLP